MGEGEFLCMYVSRLHYFALVARQASVSSGGEPGRIDNTGGSPSWLLPTKSNAFNVGSSTETELVGYIEKGKKLSNEYLSSVFKHFPSLPMTDLEDQVNNLKIS